MTYIIFVAAICVAIGLWIHHANKQAAKREEQERELQRSAIEQGIKAAKEGRQESECPYNDGDGTEPRNVPIGPLAFSEEGNPFRGQRFWWIAAYRQELKTRSAQNPKSSTIQSSSAAEGDPWLDEIVNKLIAIYVAHRNHDSQSFEIRQELEQIGKTLNEKGGLKLMRAAHAEFSRRCQARNVRDSSGYVSAPRSLEYRWNGIGAWMS
jgi:hypothetical protein